MLCTVCTFVAAFLYKKKTRFLLLLKVLLYLHIFLLYFSQLCLYSSKQFKLTILKSDKSSWLGLKCSTSLLLTFFSFLIPFSHKTYANLKFILVDFDLQNQPATNTEAVKHKKITDINLRLAAEK